MPPKHSAAAVPPAAAKNARVASSRLHACCAAQRTPPAFGTVGTLHRISPAISPTCYSLHCCRSACGVSHASRYPGASRVITGSALPALVQLFVYNAAGSVFRLAYAYPACAGFVGRDSKAPHYQQKKHLIAFRLPWCPKATALYTGQCGFPLTAITRPKLFSGPRSNRRCRVLNVLSPHPWGLTPQPPVRLHGRRHATSIRGPQQYPCAPDVKSPNN